MMKRILIFAKLLFLCSIALAAGPQYKQKDPATELEFINVYGDLRALKISSSSLPSGSTQYIQNTATLQAGSSYYVHHGSATNFEAQSSTITNLTVTNLNTLLKMKVGTFTGDAGGGQNITGVGFKPRLVMFFFGNGSSAFFAHGLGAMDADGNQWAHGGNTSDTDSGGAAAISTTRCIINTNNGGVVQSDAHFASMDADGFSITWDTPINGLVYGYIAFQ